MLVLSRKEGESIEIEGGIRVKIVAMQGGRVKVGIEAPDSVCIKRSELCFETPMPFPEPKEPPSRSARNRGPSFSRSILPR